VVAMACSNSSAVSHWCSTTQSFRSIAMCAGGPPKPRTP